jgi:hypothetical protein
MLSGALAFESARARAEADDDRPQLAVEVIGCEQPADVQAVVALELGTSASDPHSLPAHGAVNATRAVAQCEAERALLAVTDPLTRKHVERTVELEHVHASARARVIGIAIAELVSASWFELERAPTASAPRQAPGTQRARAAALQAVRAREALWRVSLGVGPLLRLSHDANAPGIGAALQLIAQSPWSARLMFDLSGAHASRAIGLGAIEATVLALGAAGLLHAQNHPLGVHAGVGLRGGIARVRGESRDASAVREGDVSGPWLGSMLVLGGALALGEWGALQLTSELGYAFVAVRGRVDGRQAAAIDGAWVTLALSLHVML